MLEENRRGFGLDLERNPFRVPNGTGHGIQVAEAGYRYKPLGLVPHLGEAHRQILSLFCNAPLLGGIEPGSIKLQTITITILDHIQANYAYF